MQRLDDERVPWCIVSAAARVEIEAGLSASGVDPRDVGIVAVDDVQRPKPDPQGHRLGLARLGRSTEDAWAVEDDLDTAIGESRYTNPDGSFRTLYHNLWALRFDSHGKCQEFVEYFMELPEKLREGS